MTLFDTKLDLLWVLLCGFLVLLMQAGFSCLESGMVRAKNSINVAIKNLVDFCIAGVLFYLVGFGLMFGASRGGIFGTDSFSLGLSASPDLLAFFFFQMVFCGTATTIVSGAVAERMRFGGYCFVAVVLSGFIYPVAGHWAWAGLLPGATPGWLEARGFVDFAGSTVVHAVGGWMALAALLVIGPRVGRFGPNGRNIEGHSLPTATLGAFLLWFGWFGFNAGSALGLTDEVPRIVVNTALAGVAGGLAGLAAAWLWLGKPVVDRIINGVIAGLVAITASCHLMHPLAAILVGALGGAICIAGMALLARQQIDDAIGAVPVHLGAGIWGTLALPLFAPEGSWGNDLSRLDQFGVQLLGVVTIGAFSFSVSYAVLRFVDGIATLRVTAEQERIRLNIAEHGSSTAILDLVTQMHEQAERGDFANRISVEPETEAASVAVFYNAVRERFNKAHARQEASMARLDHLANYDELTRLANRRLFFESLDLVVARAARGKLRGAVLYLDLDNFKEINDNHGHDAGDQVLGQIAKRMLNVVRRTDVVARIGGDEFCVVMEHVDNPESAHVLAEKLIAAVRKPIELDDGHLVESGMSVGIAYFPEGQNEQPEAVVKRADEALFEAKRKGKGVVSIWSEAVLAT